MDRKTATAVTVDELKDIGKAKMRTTDELIKEIEKGEE
jgi:hypothetical protein